MHEVLADEVVGEEPEKKEGKWGYSRHAPKKGWVCWALE